MKNNTPWSSDDLSQAMLRTSFPHLSKSNHFNELKQAFDVVNIDINKKNLIDLGCGKAEISETFTDYDYTGADLPNIIQNVSKKTNPLLKYIEFDANVSDMEFVSNYELIVMNSFLSELPNADSVLINILNNAKNYIIIHRQAFDKKQSNTNYRTYGNILTTKYTFSEEEFNSIVFLSNCIQLFNISTISSLRTIVLKKVN